MLCWLVLTVFNFHRHIPNEMAYTIERLRQAQKLFNGAISQFSVLPKVQSPYNLRERKRPEILGSWHDDSNDEDYDPDEDRVRKKCKGSVAPSAGSSPQMVRKTRSMSFLAGPNVDMDSDHDDKEETPPDPDTYHSEPEPDAWDQSWAVAPSTTPNSRYQLRPRAQPDTESPAKAKADRRAAITPQVPAFASSSAVEDDDEPTRGCEACRDLGQECSLETDRDPFAYPCAECEQDGLDCVLIPAPKWKRSCEKCRRRSSNWEPCSYHYADYDHELPCHSCIDHGYPCIAGPARHMPSVLMPQNQQIADETDEDEPMSEAILDNAEPSNINELNPIESIKIPDEENDTEGNNEDEEMGEVAMPEGNALPTTKRHGQIPPAIAFGEIHRIQTEFAHPLHFAGDRDYPREGPHCNWCHNFAYGIVGLGARNPEVIDFGTKMIEIQDGHTGEGKEETRMCLDCVCHRIKIIQCTHGSVGPLRSPESERDPSEEIAECGNFIRARDAIVDPRNNASGPPFATNREWCGICRTSAAWTCKTPQAANICEAVIDCDKLSYGCGLHLCDLCCELVKLFEGDLNAVYDQYVHEQGMQMQFRADAEFILSGADRNLVYKRMLVD